MQIQTTVTTIETINAGGVNFSVTTFEQSVSVFCDCCSSQATGTKAQLKAEGWGFWNGSEFCPEHN